MKSRLADCNTIVTQDVIGGGGMEEELRQATAEQVGLVQTISFLSACRGRNTISRASLPSICAALKPSRNARVLLMRACRSAKVCSLSSYCGTSTPACRAGTLLAKSAAICTWRTNWNMSGNRRACNSAFGSIFFPIAWASAFANTWFRALRICLKTGIEALYMEMVMSGSLVVARRLGSSRKVLNE